METAEHSPRSGSSKARGPRLGQLYLMALAFVSGMAVMGVEMCSSRLLAPFFGSSISIWTAIIGFTMMALTAGYYLGGILAERRPSLPFLGRLLFYSAIFIAFLPHLAHPFTQSALGRFAADSSSAGGSGVMVALVACALLISAPVVILGMTSPFIIRLDTLTSSEVGRAAGRMFAASTLGSLLGTFLPALALIPHVGVRFSFYFFGAALLIVVLPSLEGKRAGYWITAAFVLVGGFLMALQGFRSDKGRYLVLEKETPYQLVRIFRAPTEGQSQGTADYATALLTDAGFGLQSMWVKGRPLTDSWQDFFPIIPRVCEAASKGAPPQRILVIGLGGACAPYLISQLYPDASIDGVEIDRGLIEAAWPYFPVSTLKNLKVHISDGRLFIHTNRTKYDVIIVDAFRPPHIPAHLATTEFFRQLRGALTEDGVLGMNVGSRGEKKVFQAIANTVASAFPHVYFAQYYAAGEDSLFSSRFLVAAAKDLDLTSREVEERVFAVSDQGWASALGRVRDRAGFEPGQETFFREIRMDPTLPVLLDDRSNLDLITEREFMGLILGAKVRQ